MLLPRSSVLAPSLLVLFASGAAAQQGPRCAPDNAGLTLPAGFCALVVADGLGAARHLAVTPNGDVFVAIAGRRDAPGGVIALRDTTGDGVADVRAHFGSGTGDDVRFFGSHLYYTTNDAILRYPWKPGALEPAGAVDTIVRDLPVGGHRAKEIVITAGGAMYVNIGSPSNSCQEQDRSVGSPGKNPCPELDTRAGIWRFDANRTGQIESDGVRFATGMRNSVALALRPADGKLYAVIHGRDQLFQNWGKIGYDSVAGAEKPAEKFVRVERGDDYGWPYCYYDPQLDRYVLSPEYGGDARQAGRCASVQRPLVAFPGHWAPLGLLFYGGTAFPSRYAHGAFIAFHGSWNRAPMPQAGYNVVFVPFAGEAPAGKWEVFADGFAGGHLDPRQAAHRPVGLAQGPDGSLYVSDDQGGRIYRIVYRGEGK